MLLTVCFNVQAQSKDKLQKEYNKLMEEIQEIEKTIRSNRDERRRSLHEIQSIRAKISKREGLIDNIRLQIDGLDDKIKSTNDIIQSMHRDIATLKKEYGKLLYFTYRDLSVNNQLAFLFSARSFNQVWQRMNYLKQYSDYRKRQTLIIERTIGSLDRKISELERAKSLKISLINDEKSQRKMLIKEQKQKDDLIANLSSDEKKLRASVDKKNSDAKKVNDRIQKIIEEEIRLAKERAAKEAAKSGKGDKLGLTPEELALSNDFASNKGKLPWPVKFGHVIEKFGKHRHPDLPIYVYNNGIDIRTNISEGVRAMFDGQVVSVFYLPSNQNSVIVKHGEYFSVYSNLKEVFVKPGDKITTRQKIGIAYTDQADLLTKVHLEIWKGTEKLNPELWIAQ